MVVYRAKRGRPTARSIAAGMKIANMAKRYYKAKKNAKGKYGNPKRRYKKVNNNKRLFNYRNLEKKLIPYAKHMSLAGNPLQKLPCYSLLNNGVGTGADFLISGVVIQTGDNLTSQNLAFNTTNGQICTPVGGFRFQSSSAASPQTTPQGLPTTRMIDGNYVNFIGSKLNIRIQMENELAINSLISDEGELAQIIQEKNMPTTFRMLVVKAKRGHMVAENVKSPHEDDIPDLKNNLFIDEVGNEVGLNSLGGVQQKFRWRVNKRKFYCIKESYFKLANIVGTIRPPGQQAAGNTGQLMNQLPRHPTQKSFSLNIPVPKGKCKVNWDTNDTLDYHPLGTPDGYNYVTHVVILACKPGDNFRSQDWSVETHGQTYGYDL